MMDYTEKVNQQIKLQSGLMLGFAEYGAANGVPVIHCHGSNGSRFECPTDAEMLAQNNIRLIVPDRPGHGLSDFQPGRTLLDWADTIAELADHLKLSRFAVSGYSAGGPHALACAFKLPERVTKLGLISSLAPLDRPNAFEGVPFGARAAVWVGQHALPLLNLFAPLQAMMIKRYPEQVVKQLTAQLPSLDQESLRHPATKQVLIDTLTETYRHGGKGAVDDIRVYTAPWGFAPNDVQVSTLIWHGDQDGTSLVRNGRFLQKSIPNSQITILPNEGHFLIYRHFADMLAALTK